MLPANAKAQIAPTVLHQPMLGKLRIIGLSFGIAMGLCTSYILVHVLLTKTVGLATGITKVSQQTAISQNLNKT